jgi:hypothetical protein
MKVITESVTRGVTLTLVICNSCNEVCLSISLRRMDSISTRDCISLSKSKYAQSTYIFLLNMCVPTQDSHPTSSVRYHEKMKITVRFYGAHQHSAFIIAHSQIINNFILDM